MESLQQESSSQGQCFSCGYCNIAIQSVADLKDHLLSNHKEESVTKQDEKENQREPPLQHIIKFHA